VIDIDKNYFSEGLNMLLVVLYLLSQIYFEGKSTKNISTPESFFFMKFNQRRGSSFTVVQKYYWFFAYEKRYLWTWMYVMFRVNLNVFVFVFAYDLWQILHSSHWLPLREILILKYRQYCFVFIEKFSSSHMFPSANSFTTSFFGLFKYP